MFCTRGKNENGLAESMDIARLKLEDLLRGSNHFNSITTSYITLPC